MTKYVCPLCSYPLLSHIRSGKLYLVCRHCNQEMPYGLNKDFGKNDQREEQLKPYRNIIEEKQIEQFLEQQCAREGLIESIQERICQSLSLQEILHKTVADLRNCMQADRVIVHRFLADGKGFPVVESVSLGLPSMLKLIGHYPSILEKKYLRHYQKGNFLSMPDIRHAGLDLRLIQSLAFFKIKARLVIPILQNTTDSEISTSNPLWGLLILHQCSAPRQWQKSEIDLLEVIVNKIAIAIQKSELNQQLQKVQEKLQQLTLLDPLTLIANRSHFDEYLLSEWQRAAQEKISLSLIIWEIDFFKQYNDFYGYSAGDRCIKKIATTICSAVNRPDALIARYSGGKFAAILPNTENESAALIVEEIRFRIKALEIPHSNSKISKFISLSYGISNIIPNHKFSSKKLIVDAEKALLKSQKSRLQNKHNKVISHPLKLPTLFDSQKPSGYSQQKPQIDVEKSTNIELLISYVAYYISRGKSILSPLSGPLYFRELVYEYWGYHKNFQDFWIELQQRRDFRELYVEGDINCFGNFLDGNCTVGPCARCNLPIPISEGSAYNVPNCTLCNHQFSSEKVVDFPKKPDIEYKSAKTFVVAIGTPPSNARKLHKLFAVNGFEVTFLPKIEAIDAQFLPSVVDLVLIYAEISELQGKAWAEELRRYQQLKKVPVVGLSPQAKFSLPWVDRALGIEDYILDPLSGERLANHLRQICELLPPISVPDLYWFPC